MSHTNGYPELLRFTRLHEGYYVAPANGDYVPSLGQEVWVVRTTPALLARGDGRPWRVETPDGYIVAEGLGLSAAMRDANERAVNTRDLAR